jgi:hypothetical protein
MVVALLALLVAAAGGAYAAGSGSGTIVACVHRTGGGLYRAPKCARHDTRLRWSVTGPPGAIGPQGPQGAVGQPGTQGIQGPTGPFPTTLPTGATITGTFAVSGGNMGGTGSDWGYATISFPYPLAKPPAANYLPFGSSPTAACPGSVGNPTATSGNLCVYEGVQQGSSTPQICTPTINNSSGCPNQTSPSGAIVRVFESGFRWDHAGTWAVTG